MTVNGYNGGANNVERRLSVLWLKDHKISLLHVFLQAVRVEILPASLAQPATPYKICQFLPDRHLLKVILSQSRCRDLVHIFFLSRLSPTFGC